MFKNRKLLIVGLLSLFMISYILINAFALDKVHSSVKQNIVGQWVSVEGMCSSTINEAVIDGLDITSNYELVRNGHKAKIENMDISSIGMVERTCGELGVILFEYEVSINTTKLETFQYGKGEKGIEALALANESLYFRFTPEFKDQFDTIRDKSLSVAGIQN